MKTTNGPISVDLFCGAGGMSLGFEQAGFRVVAAFDSEQRHVDTYRLNFPNTKSFVLDLSKASGRDIRSLAGVGNRTIDVVFGGPPCQGFSVGGTRSLSDPRNTLLHHFARLLRELRPRYFVLENVEGLLLPHARRALNSFCLALARTHFAFIDPISTLNAADFGVPQRRRRVFIVGGRTGHTLPSYPTSPSDWHPLGTFTPTVADALSDLPEIELYEELFSCDELVACLGKASTYAQLLRGELIDSSDKALRRALTPGKLSGCLRTRHSKETIRRFARTSWGEVEPISRYYRLDPHGLSPTIRAGTGIDHGKHTAPRPIHPYKPRCITVREAARLHSLPDWFRLHPTRWHAFRQLGNSVPPFLARAVAHTLAALVAK